jgi:hypothetical protein
MQQICLQCFGYLCWNNVLKMTWNYVQCSTFNSRASKGAPRYPYIVKIMNISQADGMATRCCHHSYKGLRHISSFIWIRTGEVHSAIHPVSLSHSLSHVPSGAPSLVLFRPAIEGFQGRLFFSLLCTQRSSMRWSHAVQC